MRVLLLVALFAGLCCCQLQRASFEGTYTSHLFHQGTWVCQDGDFVQGSYDEVGIFHCNVGDDGVCKGEFFDAGSGPCVYGSVEISVTAEGFSGFFTCNELEGEFVWQERKLSGFRPADSKCALLQTTGNVNDDDDEDDADVQGRWFLEGNPAAPEDICFKDDGTTESSYDLASGVSGYTTGVFGFGGKVVVGTWFEDFVGGPIIYFLRNNGEVDTYWWTGLEGTKGNSVVNPRDINTASRHGLDQLKARTTTSTTLCNRYSVLRPYVLQNLDKAPSPEYYYYFVGSDFEGQGNFPQQYSSSSGTALAASAVTALAALVLVL